MSSSNADAAMSAPSPSEPAPAPAAGAVDERPLAEFEHSVGRLLELIVSVESLIGQGAELPECRNTAESLCGQAAEAARHLDAWFRQRRFVFLQNAKRQGLGSGGGGGGSDRLASLREEAARKEELIRSTERQLREARSQLVALLERRRQRRDTETPKLSYASH